MSVHTMTLISNRSLLRRFDENLFRSLKNKRFGRTHSNYLLRAHFIMFSFCALFPLLVSSASERTWKPEIRRKQILSTTRPSVPTKIFRFSRNTQTRIFAKNIIYTYIHNKTREKNPSPYNFTTTRLQYSFSCMCTM